MSCLVFPPFASLASIPCCRGFSGALGSHGALLQSMLFALCLALGVLGQWRLILCERRGLVGSALVRRDLPWVRLGLLVPVAGGLLAVFEVVVVGPVNEGMVVRRPCRYA